MLAYCKPTPLLELQTMELNQANCCILQAMIHVSMARVAHPRVEERLKSSKNYPALHKCSKPFIELVANVLLHMSVTS